MLTPEEQTLLDLLRKKAAPAEQDARVEIESPVDGRTLRLIPGAKQDGPPLVEKLRAILKDAEAGRFRGFVFVGLETNLSVGANVQWCPGSSFEMTGALFVALQAIK